MTLPDLTTDSETEFMKELDGQYRERSGLTERRYYSIFYSRIPSSPLMILGINPGGNPTTWTMPMGADEFCSAWQHDYVDERHATVASEGAWGQRHDTSQNSEDEHGLSSFSRSEQVQGAAVGHDNGRGLAGGGTDFGEDRSARIAEGHHLRRAGGAFHV
jgi:hypothetical protein